MTKSDQDWQQQLTAEQYRVTRQCGTEAPGTGKWLHNKAAGTYQCVCCGGVLFASDTKYDSGSGWPSFWAAAENANVKRVKDTSHGMVRTEVRCGTCDAHLGHVFDDGPQPTGQRFCINSAALDFEPADKATGDTP